jgi:hypothetical protein
MKLFKAVLVLALVSAAAVLIPLRRAQRAFASHAAVPAYAAAPRPSLRRRPGTARSVAKPRVSSEQSAVVESASLRGRATVRTPRRQEKLASAEHRRGDHDTGQRALSLKGQSSAGAATATSEVGDCLVDPPGATRPSHQSHLLSPVSQLAAASQADGDTPVPPPRTAAL